MRTNVDIRTVSFNFNARLASSKETLHNPELHLHNYRDSAGSDSSFANCVGAPSRAAENPRTGAELDPTTTTTNIDEETIQSISRCLPTPHISCLASPRGYCRGAC